MLKTFKLLQQIMVGILAIVLLFTLYTDPTDAQIPFLCIWFVLFLHALESTNTQIIVEGMQEQIDKLNYRLFKETQRRN